MDGPNGAAPELGVDPFRWDIESLSQLRHRHAAFDGRPSGLSVHRFDAMPKPDTAKRTRARVEHVFGAQQTSPGGRIIRTIGIARAKAKIGLQNLAYNIRRLVMLERMAAA